VVVKVMV